MIMIVYNFYQTGIIDKITFVQKTAIDFAMRSIHIISYNNGYFTCSTESIVHYFIFFK